MLQKQRPTGQRETGQGTCHCPAGIFKNIISNVTKNEEVGHGPVACHFNQEKSENRISKLLQQSKIAWINPEFSLHPNTQIEESVPLNDSNSTTSTDNDTALLGVNSSEHFEGKDTTKPPNSQENQQKTDELRETGHRPERVNQGTFPYALASITVKKGGMEVPIIYKRFIASQQL